MTLSRDGEYYGQTKPLITYNELSNWYSDKTQIVYGYFDYHGQQIAQKTTLFDLYKNGIDGYEKKLQQALTLGTISDVQYKKYIDLGNTLGKKFDAFNKILKEQNPKYDFHYQKEALVYYGLLNSGTTLDPKDVKYNGSYYGGGFDERENQLRIGEAEIKKTYIYMQDDWQVNNKTIISSSLRLDHSDLFGHKITGILGLTHNLQGNSHRRFKANVGTGYTEPGLGELYYNWEMYGGTSNDHLGWYWIGNPNLKPEKSLNFDISLEGEHNITKHIVKSVFSTMKLKTI